MDVAQLRTLLCVAELGSLSKAAERLRVAQPALSRQVRLLEEELRAPLFVRHGRGMTPTEAGTKVLARAALVMRQLEEIQAEVVTDRSHLSGQVILGIPPTVMEIITVPLTRAFQAEFPRVRLRFVSAFGGYLLEWLERGDIDLAVLYDPQPVRGLRTEPLMVENLFAVGSPAHDYSLQDGVPLIRVAKERLFLPSARHGLRKLVDKAARDLPISIDVKLEVDSLSALKDLVLAGMGTTILPLASVYADVKAGRLTAGPVFDPPLTRRLVLAYSAARPIPSAAKELGRAVVRQVHALVDSGVWAGHSLQNLGGEAHTRMI